MSGILNEKWAEIAEHLGAAVNEEGGILILGDAHVLQLLICAEDCLTLLTTNEGVISGPLIQIPLITSIRLEREYVLFASTYRGTYRTTLRVSKGGLFKVWGPTWDQVTWYCRVCFKSGQVGFDQDHQGMQSVIPRCVIEHEHVSPACASLHTALIIDYFSAEVI